MLNCTTVNWRNRWIRNMEFEEFSLKVLLCCWLVVRIRLISCGNHHNIYLTVFSTMNITVNHSSPVVLTCCGHAVLGICVWLFLVFVLVACPTARKILNDVLFVWFFDAIYRLSCCNITTKVLFLYLHSYINLSNFFS